MTEFRGHPAGMEYAKSFHGQMKRNLINKIGRKTL